MAASLIRAAFLSDALVFPGLGQFHAALSGISEFEIIEQIADELLLEIFNSGFAER